MKILILLYIIVYGGTLIVLYRQIKNKQISKSTTHLYVFTIALLCLFPVWSGDYHHIAEQYGELERGYSTNIETVYVYAAQYLTSNYFQFRILFWGTAFVLILLAYKRLHIKFESTLLFFTASSLLLFSYARVSVGMAVMFFGLSLIASPSRRGKIISNIIGFVCVGASFYFHKSTPFGIAMIAMSLVLSHLNKKKFILLSIGYIFLISVMGYYLTEFLLLDDEETLLSVDKAQRYMEATRSSGGVGANIQQILIRSDFYVVLYIIIMSIFKGNYLKFPRDIKIFAAVTLLIVAGSTVFAFDLGYNTYVIYYRFLNFAVIPMVVVLAYCYDNKIEMKSTYFALCLGVAASSYSLLYSFYLK